MKINIPKTVEIECPACDNTGHSIDDNEITTCGNCGLKLHKDELIEANKEKAIQKINPEQIAKDLKKQFEKKFKNFK